MIRRAGFTLLEILISIMIFMVISIAMVGVLSTATKLFRGGESARAANDEAIAVISMIDADLRRMVPAADGGFLYTKVLGADKAGNLITDPTQLGGCMVLAFKIRNPDPSAITETGKGSRLIVVYWVDSTGDLNRRTETAADSDGDEATISEYTVVKTLFGNPNPIARGCLYFGVDLSPDAAARTTLDWSDALPLPIGTADQVVYTTEKTATLAMDPFPGAIRLTLAITGGSRNAVSGAFIEDSAAGIRVAGVSQVATANGAMARIGDIGKAGEAVEWVEYDSFKNGVLSYQGGRPQPRRRTETQTHVRPARVYFCPTYTLVRTFPR